MVVSIIPCIGVHQIEGRPNTFIACIKGPTTSTAHLRPIVCIFGFHQSDIYGLESLNLASESQYTPCSRFGNIADLLYYSADIHDTLRLDALGSLGEIKTGGYVGERRGEVRYYLHPEFQEDSSGFFLVKLSFLLKRFLC